jgi:4-amino-4-deoxy-L-arabinose transferase-like glycosyltransferase
MPTRLTRTNAFLLVLGLWAVIFLPRLGYNELQGEEGRRTLPAIHMLETGRWFVPVVSGEDYYNKPPGINWLVAASFVVTGQQNELAARLPSALFVLAFVSMLVLGRGPWLSLPARLAGAVVFMTNLAVLEKGRLIEIEAVYICFTGMAILWWLDCFSKGSSRWILWIPPCLLLAFGALVKGPFLAAVFYPTVLAALVYRRRLREIFAVQHIVGIILILVLCLGWVYLARHDTDPEKLSHRWATELGGRLTPQNFTWAKWLVHIPLALVFFSPWIVFVPLLWVKRLTSAIAPEHLPLLKAGRLGLVVGFALLNLTPEMLPRYTLPVIPLASILVGWLLASQVTPLASDRYWKWLLIAFMVLLCLVPIPGLVLASHGPVAWIVVGVTVLAAVLGLPRLWSLKSSFGLTMAMGLLCGLAMLQYVGFVAPVRKDQEKQRPAAQAIDDLVPSDQTLYSYKPGYHALFFYIRHPAEFLLEPQEIDSKVRYLLLEKEDLDDPQVQSRLGQSAKVLYEVSPRISGDMRLLDLRPAGG